jgi:hypothetical protein
MQRSTSSSWILTTRRACTVASLAIAAFAAGSARAQNVLLSEVRADAGGRWVELHNRTQAPVDVSTWSLHFCSRTPGAPQTYWWPFPAGTVIAANGYLKIDWYQNGVNVPGAPELWTGTSPYAFLFGLGSEPLTPSSGALALFSSQANEYMNTASVIVDWVSWGEHAFPREDLAVSVGLWATGRNLPAIPTGQSLARDPAAVGTVAFPDLAWFVDNTPTPLQPNVAGAVVQSQGAPCTLPGHHLLGLPVLQASSLPLIGSTAFGLAVSNTTGIPGEFVLVAFSTAGVPPGTPSILPPFAGITCQHEVDLAQLVTTWIAPTQILATSLPLSLAGLSSTSLGAELHAQALVLDLMPNAWPPFQGTTNGLRLVVGQ